MIEITTPPGRIVWGHPTKSKTKTDQRTRQPVLKDGQPVQMWSFGIAFDKAVFQQHIWPAMAQEAATAYPQGVPPAFSWKYVDGDGVDREGKPYNQREGYAGHYVLAISSELMAPPLFKLVNGAYQQLQPDQVKCGDWVSAGIAIKVNVPTDRTHTPGLYINPLALEFIGYGTEIQSQGSVDPAALFRGQQHQLPPGASATPLASAGAPGMPGMGTGQPMQPPPGGQPGYPPQGQPMGAPPPQQGDYPQPGYAPAPMAQPPGGQPGYAPQGAPAPGYGQPGQMPPPAPDFVQNAGGQPGYAPPPQQGGYAPAPGMQPPQGQPMGQPAYGQPGGMPGMMPPR